MLEWLKRHAWKACVPQKGIASSNLALSAKKPALCVGFFASRANRISPAASQLPPGAYGFQLRFQPVPPGRRIAPPSRHAADAAAENTRRGRHQAG